MRFKKIKLISILFIISGLLLICFPIISNYISEIVSKSKISDFNTQAGNIIDDGNFKEALINGVIDSEGYPINSSGSRTGKLPLIFRSDLNELYQECLSYNSELILNQSELLTNDFSYTKSAIDLKSYGISNCVFGYVSAPAIDMQLPIYLGANEANMRIGAAHLSYTSLPIGGQDCNTVLAAHTGYIGKIFFDNITKLKSGDTVTVTNYWNNLEYTVVESKICSETDAELLFINKGKDLLTLMTCISNNKGGFNRYIVICQRK